jgi:hypothetical protein
MAADPATPSYPLIVSIDYLFVVVDSKTEYPLLARG